jgi:hypothetical protein
VMIIKEQLLLMALILVWWEITSFQCWQVPT